MPFDGIRLLTRKGLFKMFSLGPKQEGLGQASNITTGPPGSSRINLSIKGPDHKAPQINHGDDNRKCRIPEFPESFLRSRTGTRTQENRRLLRILPSQWSGKSLRS